MKASIRGVGQELITKISDFYGRGGVVVGSKINKQVQVFVIER